VICEENRTSAAALDEIFRPQTHPFTIVQNERPSLHRMFQIPIGKAPTGGYRRVIRTA
jgi:hypothetical protein